MITTLRIKKTYIYFFVASILISLAVVTLLNNSVLINGDPLRENCSKHSIKVYYKYRNNLDISKSSYVHNVLVNILNDKLLETYQSKNEFYFNGDKVEFIGENCKKNSDKLFSLEKDIKSSIRSYLINFDDFLSTKEIRPEIYDINIMYYIFTDEDFFKFEINREIIEDHKAIKNTIKFLIVVFLLNLLFYLIRTINFKFE